MIRRRFILVRGNTSLSASFGISLKVSWSWIGRLGDSIGFVRVNNRQGFTWIQRKTIRHSLPAGIQSNNRAIKSDSSIRKSTSF